MTREEANAFVEALVKLRTLATDEMSLEVPNLYPTWKEGVEYKTGERVLHDGVLYKVLQDHTSQEAWTPTEAHGLFAKVLIPTDEIPAWEQPDSTNAYMKGDKVTYEGKTYVSTVDNNVWKPNEYGWEEVS